MKKIFAILIALSALSNFSCKEKEEEYTEGGLVFGGIYMLDGQQLVETDGYILELPAEQNTVELRIVSKGVQEFGIGGYPMSGLGEYKVEGFTIKVTPDPASEKLEIYDYIDVEYKGEQQTGQSVNGSGRKTPLQKHGLHCPADCGAGTCACKAGAESDQAVCTEGLSYLHEYDHKSGFDDEAGWDRY